MQEVRIVFAMPGRRVLRIGSPIADEDLQAVEFVPRQRPRARCLVAPSGKFVDSSSNLEMLLLSHIGARLAEAHVSTLIPTMPPRRPEIPVADDATVTRRTEWLQAAYMWLLEDDSDSVPIGWLGFSLGAQHLLGMAAATSAVARRLPRAMVLIGCVVEHPVFIHRDVRTVHLIYGENDCIVYRDESGAHSSPLAPNDYAGWSAQNIVLTRTQSCVVSILRGRGHLLTSDPDDATTVAEDVASALAEALFGRAC